MRSTIIASLVISAAAAVAFACGSPPEPKPPTDQSATDAGSSSGGSSSGSSGASGTSTTPSPDAGSTASASSGATPAVAENKGFDALSSDKKLEIMMTKVVPNVGKSFKEFNAKKFDKFGCKTCHGDAKVKSKDDPKKVVPKLTFSGGGLEKLQKSKADMMKFMNDKVLPGMADALGEKVADKPMDPASKTGFACNGCHTID